VFVLCDFISSDETPKSDLELFRQNSLRKETNKLAPDAFLVNSKHAPSADCDSCNLDGLLPVGIEKAGQAGIAATRLLPDWDSRPAPSPQNPITIAVFDFDGTCINGSSPMRLVNVLIKHRKLNPYKMLRLLMWGAAYKLNLPKDAEGVRTRVFSAFEGFSAKSVFVPLLQQAGSTALSQRCRRSYAGTSRYGACGCACLGLF
jgi:hypothetical protein